MKAASLMATYISASLPLKDSPEKTAEMVQNSSSSSSKLKPLSWRGAETKQSWKQTNMNINTFSLVEGNYSKGIVLIKKVPP